VEIVPELLPWATWVIDKSGYSALGNASLRQAVSSPEGQCLILSGVETDVCVLSTVMEAIDLGLRVILAADAMASSVAQCHDLALQILEQRFDEQVEIATKYAGYIGKQAEEVERAAHFEHLKLPPELDYADVTALSFEVRQKLNQARPATLGQAGRVSGVTPAAISVLMVYLKRGALLKESA